MEWSVHIVEEDYFSKAGFLFIFITLKQSECCFEWSCITARSGFSP